MEIGSLDNLDWCDLGSLVVVFVMVTATAAANVIVIVIVIVVVVPEAAALNHERKSLKLRKVSH